MTTQTVPTQTVTYTLPETRTSSPLRADGEAICCRTMSSTSLKATTLSSTTLSFTTVTMTWTAASSRTWTSTTVTTQGLATWGRPAVRGEYAKEVAVTMELQHIDYHRLS